MDKKKIILIAGLIAVIVIGIIIVLISRNGKSEYTKIFEGTDYPGQFKNDNGNIILEIESKSNTELSWNIEVENNEIFDATLKGGDSGKKNSFIISPKTVGYSLLILSKEREIEGEKIKTIEARIPVSVAEATDGMYVSIADGSVLVDNGGGVGGTGTDSPYYLKNDLETGVGMIIFSKETYGWTVEPGSGIISVDSGVNAKGQLVYSVSYNPNFDPVAYAEAEKLKYEGKDAKENNISTEEVPEITAEEITEEGKFHTVLTMKNEGAGVTEYVNVDIEDERVVILSTGEAPKK